MTRLDELSRMRRLPAGVTKDAVDAAKTAVADMTASWSQAVDAYGAVSRCGSP